MQLYVLAACPGATITIKHAHEGNMKIQDGP